MRTLVYILFLVISVALLEAGAFPQSTNIKRRPWKPKAIREKEAAKARNEAARLAEEAAKVAEPVVEVADQTTEIGEDTTVISDETTEITEQFSTTPTETTSLVTSTATSSDHVKVAAKHVALLERMAVNHRPLPTSMVDIPSIDKQPRFSRPVFKESKDDMKSNRQAPVEFVTGRRLIQQTFSASTAIVATRAPVLTKRAPGSAEENDCRLFLRGARCQCRLQRTCRCACSREATTNQPIQSAIRLWPTRMPVRS